MIIRARPKYLANNDFNRFYAGVEIKTNEFYFTSGRAALKFYLNYLSGRKNKRITIAMQAFNCHVVMDAALESGCKVKLMDIKIDDFSISYESMKNLDEIKKLDVLLLTHYQGLPNREYEKIINFCKKYNIIVIEDLAQTIGSKINGVEVGSLGDVCIYSYAFDKPFSCLKGGKLKFNIAPENEFIRKYEILKMESEKDANLDIKTLKFLHKYTNKHYYKKGIDNVNLISFLLMLNISEKFIYRLLHYKTINKFYNLLLKILNKKKYRKIIIEKLNLKKVSLVKAQEERYQYNDSNVLYLAKLCEKYRLKCSTNNMKVKWNRFSVIDETGDLKSHLLHKGFQIGNFNWPQTLDNLYRFSHDVEIFESLENSDYASKYILNIPIWDTFMSEENNEQ